MKVLFNTYPMAFEVPGGGERQLMAYYRHLPRYGVQPTLFNQWEPRIREHDLVHFFSVFPGSWPFCSHVKQHGVPLVVSSTLWITEETKHQYPLGDIQAQLPYADRIVTNSDLEAQQLSSFFGLPRDKFVTVYNGVEEEFCAPADPAPFLAKHPVGRPFILNVANIEPRKNQLAFIRACKQATDFKLVIVGHIRDREYATRCFAEGGDQVVHIGPLPYNSPLLRSAIAACELFAMPSLLETPSIAALEAAAAGARVLVTEIGSTREYFGDYVTYVDPHSEDAMRIGIGRAIAAPRGVELASHLRARFTWSKVTDDLANCYKSLRR